jgi:hypothetical protein
MNKSRRLTDHDEIRAWAERHDARPTRVKETAGSDGGGVLRFDFGPAQDRLEEIPWQEFFAMFEESDLALIVSGDPASRFVKFVGRDR